jgi:F0F1-type ATP synthase gamma subunit
MRPIAELKKEIVFNREMNELVDILKKVAVAQFQIVFNRWKGLGMEQRFTNLIPTFFEMLDIMYIHHPLFTNPPTNVLSVIITSDAGFLGGLNTTIIEMALGQKKKKERVEYTVVGEKGREYVETKVTAEDTAAHEPFSEETVSDEKGRGYVEEISQRTSFNFIPGISDEVGLEEAKRLSNHIFRICLKDKIGKVLVTYPKFISFGQQEVEVLNIFEWLKIPQTPIINLQSEITYEPFLDKVADYLLRLCLTHKIYEIYWHSKLSEFAARMMHLESSIQELTEMKKQISLQYFKSKHEITDRTIRDIFGGLLTTQRKAKKNREVISYN